MERVVYSDNAATTPISKNVYNAMLPYLTTGYGNPSSLYKLGRDEKKAMDEARGHLAKFFNCDPNEIYFTSGGSEADNLAIKGLFFSGKLPKNKRHIITSTIEHHAVLYTCEFMQKIGYDVTFVGVDEQGHVKLDELENAITEDTALVSIMAANNEIGTIQDLKAISDICHKHGVLFHTDAVQAVGHIPIDVKEMGIDMLSASAHKFNGPKGVGFLYSRNGLLQPYHHGGSQEFGMRAGTENVPAIVGMAVALRKNVADMEQNTAHLNHLTEMFLSMLQEANLDFILNGHPTNRLPGNINISFKGRSGEGLMHMLDLKGICVSTGSACDSVNQQVSHVIKAIGVPDDYNEGTIRVTFGKDNTEQEALNIANTLIKLVRL